MGAVLRIERGEGELLFFQCATLTHSRKGRSSVRGMCAPAVGSLLRQEELAFIKAASTLDLSLFLLRT